MSNKEKNMNVFIDFSNDKVYVLTIAAPSETIPLFSKVLNVLLDNYREIDFYRMDLGKLENILKGE